MRDEETEMDARLSALQVSVPDPPQLLPARGQSGWSRAAIGALTAAVLIAAGVVSFVMLRDDGMTAVSTGSGGSDTPQSVGGEIEFSFPDGTPGSITLPEGIAGEDITMKPEIWLNLPGETLPGLEKTHLDFYRGGLPPYVEVVSTAPVGAADLLTVRVDEPFAEAAGVSGEIPALVWTAGDWTVVIRMDEVPASQNDPAALAAAIRVTATPEGFPVVSVLGDAVRIAPDMAPRMHFIVASTANPITGDGPWNFILELDGCNRHAPSRDDEASACREGSTTRLLVHARERERSLLLEQAQWAP